MADDKKVSTCIFLLKKKTGEIPIKIVLIFLCQLEKAVRVVL